MKKLFFVFIAVLCVAANAHAGKGYTNDTAPATCVDGDFWIDTNGTSSERFHVCEEGTWVKHLGNGTTSNPSFLSVHASGGNLAAANAQVTKKWITGLSYTADVTSVIHGGQHYICTSTHTAGASTEPGVGASWATVWAVASGSGGYTNLTSFVDQTAWRVFYSDGAGDVKELALGSDGEYLKSNGASSAPSWATPTGAAHDSVTLGTDADAILGLSTQQITLDSQTANRVFAAPNGSAGDPTFRALVAADLPATVMYSGSTGYVFSLGALSDLTILDTGSTYTALIDDTVAYGGTYDAKHLWSIDKVGAELALKLTISDIDDTPVNNETSAPISSNWAYDHAAATATHGVSGAIVGSSDSATLTNKTIDVEGTGNAITIVDKIWFAAAGCNNTTATSFYDLPTTAAPAAACITGTNTQKGVLDFDADADERGQVSLALPSDFTGAIDVKYKWLAAATTGSVVWGVQTSCVADAETDDPSWNTASTVTDAAKGTTLQTNDASITGVTATGCAAGELLHLRFFRDADNGSDNMTGDARLIGAEVTIRRAQ